MTTTDPGPDTEPLEAPAPLPPTLPPSSPSDPAHMQIAGHRVTMPLVKIRPYWRNPRLVPEEAVNALAKSIEDYGYRQPIVVDEQGVIIVGHTRYAAVRKLGYDAVPVLVAEGLTPEQVRALRVVDNRVAELTEWDYDALADELQSLDVSLRDTYFPEVTFAGDPGVEEPAALDPNATQTSESGERSGGDWAHVVEEVEFVCPKCFHQWELTVTREMILSGKPLAQTEE